MHKRKSQDMIVADLQQIYRYDKATGNIYNLQQQNRRMFADVETSTLDLRDKITKLRKKLLYKNACYALATGEYLPIGKKLLQLDLNSENFAFSNLKLVPVVAYTNVLNALANLASLLKIVQHPNDKHAYLLQWHTLKNTRSVVYHDIAAANAAKTIKTLEFVKIVNKYIPTE